MKEVKLFHASLQFGLVFLSAVTLKAQGLQDASPDRLPSPVSEFRLRHPQAGKQIPRKDGKFIDTSSPRKIELTPSQQKKLDALAQAQAVYRSEISELAKGLKDATPEQRQAIRQQIAERDKQWRELYEQVNLEIVWPNVVSAKPTQ